MEIIDENEGLGLFEPLVIGQESKHRGVLSDLALDLAQRSEGLRRSLPKGLEKPLAEVVRSMNCYYSNLIEGHNTHPVDIERALKQDFSSNIEKRNLQLEAKAHIAVQQWIDADGLSSSATHIDSICAIHQKFCEALPEQLLQVSDLQSDAIIIVTPGELRKTHVQVGRHVAISAGALPRFMSRFHEAYDGLGKMERIISSGAIHHRLLWVHPFLDGNGRVARLMSYAIFRELLNTGGLWSISRGLARKSDMYKQHLAACDLKKRNDLDGRGTLSEEALAKFCHFFLTVSIDQVTFMEELMSPARLRDRILIWTEEMMRSGTLPLKSDVVLKALLYEGQLERGQVPTLLGLSDRSARRITSSLLEYGIVESPSPRGALRLTFPVKIMNRWMPGLFPEI